MRIAGPAERASRTRGLHSQALWSALACALPFTLFWVRGIAQLYTRHPHEDAFILFRYVEHIAVGLGITFNPGGPRAEGATDFLWAIMLALPTSMGLDVALSALLFNSLGSALLAYVLLRLCTCFRASVPAYAAAVALAACVPFVGAAHAAYDGFSTQLYVALVVLLYSLYLCEHQRALLSMPYVALLLGLFRPDGVIIGAGFCALGFARVGSDRVRRKPLGGRSK
jgi:hypothetical protein